MKKNLKNIAIVLSAGSGSRFGADIPKQFINLAGKNIIEYTLAAFQQNPNIDEICLVADPAYHAKLQQLATSNQLTKLKKIIAGGKERQDSSYQAIQAYQHLEEANLIFHDGVRPFISQEIINACVEALASYSALDVAIPTADTIIQLEENQPFIHSLPKRSQLMRGQTPQAFKLSCIQQAHQLAQADPNPPPFTDDCGLIKHYLPQLPIYIVAGEEKNIKITYPEDLLFAEKLLQLHSLSPTQANPLSQLNNQVLVVFGGTSGIGKAIAQLASQQGAQVFTTGLSQGCDITNPQQVEEFLTQVNNQAGRISAVINTAATLTKKPLIDTSAEEISQEVNTNLLGAINVAKASYPYLKASQGMLLLFTSSSYTRGRSNYSIYSATKAANVNLTQALAEEWQPAGIKVNIINPARTATPMRTKNFGKEPANTLLTAEEVAEASLNTLLSGLSGLVIDVK